MRVQCEHVEDPNLLEPAKTAEASILRASPDRVIALGGSKIVFVLCPSCKDIMKTEVGKWV